jgi:hypothetical protein
MKLAMCLALVGILTTMAAKLADAPTGTLSGAVTINGVPLPEGKLGLHAAAGKKPLTLPIKDGKFRSEKIAAGEYTVTIVGTGVPVKYGSPATSSLKVSIGSGANEIVFDLKAD